jgi:hypothetical protein
MGILDAAARHAGRRYVSACVVRACKSGLGTLLLRVSVFGDEGM